MHQGMGSVKHSKTVLHNVSHLLAILALEFAPTVLLNMFSTPLVPVFPSRSAPKTALPVTSPTESVELVPLVTPPTQLEFVKRKFLAVNFVLMIRVTRSLGCAFNARQAIIQLLSGAVYQMLTAVANALLNPVTISVGHALSATLDFQLTWLGFVLLSKAVVLAALYAIL